jgi:photosystem I P700 chlorophyll a apoprotein A2
VFIGQAFRSALLSQSFALGPSFRNVVSSAATGIASTLSTRSQNLELSLSLVVLSSALSVLAQHSYAMPSIAYLPFNQPTTIALYVHHQWLASLFMLGAFVHGTLFLIRDKTMSNSDLIFRLLSHKSALVSHLSWVTLWLGFHTLLVYSHNDAVVALGQSYKQILLDPVFAQLIQSASGVGYYGLGTLGSSGASSSFFLQINTTDLLAHHAIALGLHTTVLILLKGALDSRGSTFFVDKLHMGYAFPCDGPGRGGSCDVSSWDSFYLSFFWLLNTLAWTDFYFHWRVLSQYQGTGSLVDTSGTYLLGWFRDYLWYNSAPLIQAYRIDSLNDQSVWSWTFLLAHLIWATGFMFLISWRGYWQELIDSIVYMHLRSPLVGDLWSGGVYTPVALSIVQARFVGLAHFAIGFILTYSSFVIAVST